MKQQQLDEIKRRAEAATPDWEAHPPYVYGHSIGGVRMEHGPHMVLEARGFGHLKYHGEEKATAQQDANVVFAAHARQDVPALIAEVERLRPIAKAEELERGLSDGEVEREYAEDQLATGDSIRVRNLVNRLLLRQRTQAAIDLEKAAIAAVKHVREMEAKTHEAVDAGMMGDPTKWEALPSVDLEPLMKAADAYEAAQ